MEKYFIFSDESGSWSNKDDEFYVRSWLKIKEEDYLYLVGLWTKNKFPLPAVNSLMKNSNNISDELSKKDFNYFFTFTRLNEFYSRKFYVRDKVLESVSLALSQLESQIKEYVRKIPQKVQNGIDQILFLHIYEAYHIENAVTNLCKSDDSSDFLIDKPQFTENDYLEVFNNKKQNYSFQINLTFSSKKDENLGICYADALASLVKKILEKNSSNGDISFFKKYVFPKSVAGNIGVNGFNKVFYPVNKSYGKDELRVQEKEIITNLVSKITN